MKYLNFKTHRYTLHLLQFVLLTGLLLLVQGIAAKAAARNVPASYSTIQAAIDAAVPGESVVIADGTYSGPGNYNLNFGGKDITVRSASGNRDACIISCDYSGRGFEFTHGETSAATI